MWVEIVDAFRLVDIHASEQRKCPLTRLSLGKSKLLAHGEGELLAAGNAQDMTLVAADGNLTVTDVVLEPAEDAVQA